MTLKIRRAKADDTPVILSLMANSVRNLSEDAYSSEQIEAIVRLQSAHLEDDIDSGNALIFVGELDRQLVATAFATLAPPPTRWTHSLWIGGVYIHPEFARRGISRQLLQKVEEEAWRNNVDTLLVSSSLAAIPFYQSMSYRCNKRTSFLWGQHQIDCMEMSKFLAGQRRKNYGELLIWIAVCIAAVLLVVMIKFF